MHSRRPFRQSSRYFYRSCQKSLSINKHVHSRKPVTPGVLKLGIANRSRLIVYTYKHGIVEPVRRLRNTSFVRCGPFYRLLQERPHQTPKGEHNETHFCTDP